MKEKTLSKLSAYQSEYISIGVTEGERGYNGISIPWEHTATAFNMKTPDIFISKEELLDDEVMSKLKEFKVVGFYITVPIEDYSFLKDFPEIRDLNIWYGKNLTDLSFLESLKKCMLLYMENIKAKDLSSIAKVKYEKLGKGFFDFAYNCVALCDCDIEDISDLMDPQLRFNEFLVWNPKGKNEWERWKNVKASTFRYFEHE